MSRDWKIVDSFLLTGRGPTLTVEMPDTVQLTLPVEASVVVDGVETQKIIISHGGFFAYRSVEAREQSSGLKAFQSSKPVERNVGRDWILRIHD